MTYPTGSSDKITVAEDLPARLARAKELLRTAQYASMATVNDDGTPHNTPFYLILDKELKHVYFGSHPGSLHSKNVVRTGELFAAVYDMRAMGGLYIKAVRGCVLTGSKLMEGLVVHNAARARDGEGPLEQAYYEGVSPQRMYGADIVTLWVNMVERGEDGHITREYRREIRAIDLL